MENKKELAVKLERITVFISGLFLLFFPIVISTLNTDAYIIPKQILLAVAVLIGLVLWGVKAILLGGVTLRRTPYDLPIFLFGGALFLSALFAVNKADSLISFVPMLFVIILFYLITNSAKKAQDVLFLTGALITGSIVVSLISLLSYLKIYVIPFEAAKFQTFTPFGSLFDQAIYLILVLSLCIYLAWPVLKKKTVEKSKAIYVIGTFFLLIGSLITIIGVATLQKPTLLPYQAGFQTAFASISQDTGRVVSGFLLGSGVGTFLTDFTKFKPATINNDAALWNVTFLRSSSYVLELIATTGLLGILAFLFLVYRILRSKPLFVPLVLIVVFSLLVPFSFSSLVLFFVLLAIYSAQQGLSERYKNKFFDVELKLVTLKRGVFALSAPGEQRESEYGNLLPFGFLILTSGLALLLGILSFKFTVSDYWFQQSLVAANQNNAQKTYELQTKAIKMFPQRDGYHRIYSQINLSIANNLASSVPQGEKPSAETQQTIYQLIQQSINSGRNATTVAPQTSVNWQNLSSIYRSLIGFGQNADQFSVVANQQALALDPNNPQQYINYGGIFYQLGQWDNAIRQFQIAASLKPDFANAYYNLGHALEQKGDLEQALAQYETVKSLVANDKPSVELINKEITAIRIKIGDKTITAAKETTPANNQAPLGVDQPQAKLPAQNPQVKIPAPKATPKVSPTPTPRATITPAPNL